jgi:osmoprotectant transport system substrate-binding protein
MTCGRKAASWLARPLISETVSRAASAMALAVVCSACASWSGRGPPPAGDPSGRRRDALTVGSFDLPESVLLAGIYGNALAAKGLPVRILPDPGSREVADPALMSGLVQPAPGYAGSALEVFTPGGLSAPSDAGAGNTAHAGPVAGRGLVAARPAPAQDANAIAVTVSAEARWGLRSIADLPGAAPGLVFGGPSQCPGRAYCPPGPRRVYGVRFGVFIPLDVGSPLALEAGDIGAAPLFTTDPNVAARHLVVLADGRELEPHENITALVRRDVITGYGPGVVAVLNAVPAPLGAGTLRALDGRVELAGQNPRLAAASWLRAHELIPAGGGVH